MGFFAWGKDRKKWEALVSFYANGMKKATTFLSDGLVYIEHENFACLC
jgi:hypothetical protein